MEMAVIEEIRPQKRQEEFLSTSADIAIYGGAAGGGKTWALLIEPLRHIANQNFKCVIVRRTYTEIIKAGAMWDESFKLYPMVGGTPKVGELRWNFPSGARIEFGHFQDEARAMEGWQGAQIPLILFDELTHFTERQFFWLLSRNRSKCGVDPYVRATCNPDADSWVAKFVEWWIDPDSGLPIWERSGVLRYFVRIGGELVWADSAEELTEKYDDVMPKSVTFVPATLEDNPALMSDNPTYKANVLALPHVERERLYHGNWRIRNTEGSEWEDHPEYFESHIWTDELPDSFEISCLAVDPSKGKTDSSDYSALVFVGLSGNLLWVFSDIRRRSTEVIARHVVDLFQELSPGRVVIEGNQFQDLLAPMIDGECSRRNHPPLPIELIYHTSGEKKELRIRRLEPYLARRMFRVANNEGGQLLLRQLRNFGTKDHDDGPDALEMAIRCINRMAREPDDDVLIETVAI